MDTLSIRIRTALLPTEYDHGIGLFQLLDETIHLLEILSDLSGVCESSLKERN